MTKENTLRHLNLILETDINTLKGFDTPHEALENEIKALKEAIKFIEQEPKQVVLEGDGYADGYLVYDYGKCPKCDWQYEEGDKDWKEPFCCHCGQRLKWFEE